ncbi:hypothetical protein Phum_PHUM580210 [Pediculus humanus corporis]|uniref:Uncharacterized protein n=1 Tax=Pediculus humanus subsp. corporis TaxID=121224 RepID=E0W1W8_PEDHC|nr:uncharacterized protein Phum_PHUM580210 [Pediculus humanus corporis]EEB19562.1 hypothetical protein Phum_PHUM580210 [Pediculus humanus corporis]
MDVPSSRRRYARSSTHTAIAQYLTDSCSSLLHKLTTRVRGPSQVVESNNPQKNRSYFDIYSDVRSRFNNSAYDHQTKQFDKKQQQQQQHQEQEHGKTEAGKDSKRDWPDVLKNSYGVVKSNSEKFLNLKSGINEESVKRRIEEVNRETENCGNFSRTCKIYPKESKNVKKDDERVRPPERVGNKLKEEEESTTTTTTSSSSTLLNSLGSTRMRLEDKYSDVLNKMVRKRQDVNSKVVGVQYPTERKYELAKSCTTASVLLCEKAYPFVATPRVAAGAAAPRDKTPFRVGEDPSLSSSSSSSCRSRRHRSYKDELMPAYRKSGPLCTTDGSKSSLNVSSSRPYLKICSIDIDKKIDDKFDDDDEGKSVEEKKCEDGGGGEGGESVADKVATEREVRRKEIQNLINKYSMLDEAYNRLSGGKMKKSKGKDVSTKQTTSAMTSKSRQQQQQQQSNLICDKVPGFLFFSLLPALRGGHGWQAFFFSKLVLTTRNGEIR